MPLRARCLLVVAALTLLAATGCSSIPKGMRAVDAVEVNGAQKLDGDDVADRLATAPSAKFLGLFRGVVVDYQLFDQHVLERDLQRVERFYRARGYYEAHARAGRVLYKGDKHVEVAIEVEEGPVTPIGKVMIVGLEKLPPEHAKLARAALGKAMAPGKPFDEEEFERAETAMKKALTDVGYAYAKVSRGANVDVAGKFAVLGLHVDAGPVCTFGKITVTGLGKLPEVPVKTAIDIVEGAPYSTATLDSARQAVLDLGAFSSVEVIPDLTGEARPDHRVDVSLKVTGQRLHSVTLGGGLEFDPIKSEVHLRVGWEHKNLFGGFRHFQVDAQPGVVLYPTRLPNLAPPKQLLPEEKLRVELRQPGFIEARTEAFLRNEVNTYPVLLTPDVDPAAPVLGYFEYKASTGVARNLLKKLRLTPSYNFQYDLPFPYVGTKDPDLRGLIVSYIDLLAQLDYRNDKLHPHKGFYIQNDLQFAGLGGNARDVRVQPEARGYIPLGRRFTLAGRATVGFLFPLNYGTTLTQNGALPPDADRARWVEDLELMYLRGFFSGGPSSNRGYPLRGVGPHGIVPFFNPGVASQQLQQSCTDISDPAQAADCAVPFGGQSLWELSLEFRAVISGPFGGVAFCDASDVALGKLMLRLDHPHVSCGLGARYDTPIGPVRLDVGYRIPGLQSIGTPFDERVEGDPGTVFGAPIAISFGIGETF